MARFFLHAVGRDRPGIVAALAGALADFGCNLEDSRMTLLRGQFAVMLVLDAPGLDNGAMIERVLAASVAELDLVVAVLPLDAGDDRDDRDIARESVVLAVSVHGADHPGIVARIASEVAASGANIVDLATRLVGGGTGYVLLLSVELPTGPDSDALANDLRERLARAGDELGVHCQVTAGDADVI